MSVHRPPQIAHQPLALTAAQAAAEYSPALSIALDAAGRIYYANAAALAELRCDRDAVMGRPFIDLLDEGSQAKGRALLDAAQRGPTTFYELNVVAGDETVILMGIRAVPVAPPSQEEGPRDVVLLGRSLSPVVMATERLVTVNRRLHALYALAATASRSLVLEDMLDQALSVAMAELNVRAGAIFLLDAKATSAPGQAAPAATGAAAVGAVAVNGFSTAFTGRLSRPGAFAAWCGGDLAGRVITGDLADLTMEPSDLTIRTGPLLSLAIVPIRSDDRDMGWLLALADHYRAFMPEEMETLHAIGSVLGPPIENAWLFSALQEAGGQLRTVLRSIDSGILLVGVDGTVQFANEPLGRLLQADVAAWPGQPRAALLEDVLIPLGEKTPGFDADLWVLDKDKSPRRVLRRFLDEVVDETGAPLGSIEVYSDVTVFYESDRLKDEFVAAAAHDLKSPMTAIRGYAQIALRLARRADQQAIVQPLEMVDARSRELTLLMDSLLDMSRLQGSRLLLELEMSDLGALISHAVGYFDYDLRRQGRTVTVENQARAVEVTWDVARMERVLINLVGNALKYSPDGGPVEVRVRYPQAAPDCGDQCVEIAVTDHGIGIPPDERERIFERFYRARAAAEAGFKGTGLGLHICRGIVAAHGGRIWATEARHGGAGTSVVVAMPVQAAVDADSTA